MREGWEYKKLGEIASFINGDRGKNYPSAKDFVEDGVPFINAGHLCNGIINFDKMNYITYNKYSSLGSGKIQQHDILFCLRGSLGKFAIVKEKSLGAIASSLVIIRPSQIVDDRFIAHFLSTPKLQEYIDSNNNGSSQPNLSAKSVASFIIPLPPKSTQLSIISELDKINELIRLKKEQLKDYDNLAQSIFYEMFGDPVENEKGWEVKKMKDVCTHIVDCPHSTPKKADTTTNYPCIRTSELKGGTISWSTMQYLEKDEYEKRIARLKPETGDIIFGREGTIGDAVILPSGYNFSLGQRTMLIRTDNEMIINTFMHRTLMSEWIKHQIEYVNVSSTVAHVNIKDFKLFDVPLPPIPLQHLFAQRIEQIERQKSAVQKSITDLETLLASRMQYWFE